MADYKKTRARPKADSTGKTPVSPKKEGKHLNEKDRLIASVVLFACGILLLLLAFIKGEKLWGFLHDVLFGLFGMCGFLTGVTLIYIAIRLGGDRPGLVRDRIYKTLLALLFLCGLVQVFFVGNLPGEGLFGHIGGLFESGTAFSGGGVLSLITAGPLLLFGEVGAKIIAALLVFVVVMLVSGVTLAQLVAHIRHPLARMRETAAEKRAIAQQIREDEAEYAKLERSRRAAVAERGYGAVEYGDDYSADEPKPAYDNAFTFGKSGSKSAEAIIEQRIETDRFNKKINALAQNIPQPPSPKNELRKTQMFESVMSAGIDNDDDDDEVTVPPISELRFADEDDYTPVSLNPLDLATGNTAPILNVPATTATNAPVPAITVAPPNTAVPVPAAVPAPAADTVPPWESDSNAVLDALGEYEKEREAEQLYATARETEIETELTAEPVQAQTQTQTESPDTAPAEAEVIIADERDTLYISEPLPYSLPPSDLLDTPVFERSDEDIDAEIDANSDKLISTLRSFGVQAHMVGVSRGPSVTRYEIQPGSGVKISKITGLSDDIALNLAAAGVRIEAPIPGKSAVGVEVPNKIVETVPFRSLIESEEFTDTKSKLGAALGKAISGESVICDVAKMPHLLIAGTTGSGKSVCVNTIIMSILFRSTPDDVRFIMVDPKSVEFMIYNGIPHLLIPVVTDPKKASGALAWAVTEMENRYKTFASYSVRDLKGCNAVLERNGEKPLPQIVIFIDELADLMMAAPGEVESSICRLAQMARAAGMHLVIATQRPTVNVVTGLIKANIPSRIALKVASQIDSRTILDTAGADKLLGKGDMLFSSVSMPKPQRVQGAWVSDKEVERVVEFIKNTFNLEYDESVMEEIEKQAEQLASAGRKKGTTAENEPVKNPADDIDTSDERLEDAIEAVIEFGQASTSYLQRKLGLGYGRAARIIDTLEKMGIVGAFDGKKRQVLMTRQQWLERFNNR
ncbi:hypothetical protein FACS1894133_5070 [Clostridia bacterium]|nr:hypothetical protein FACS1894133_5070 [Clostridia bacterium]